MTILRHKFALTMNSLIIILQVKENKNAKYSAYFDNVNLKNQVLSVSVLFVLNYI